MTRIEIGARFLRFKAEGEGRVRLQGAFMKFVENDAGDAGELGIGHETAGQYAFGDDFHAGFTAHAAFQADAVADAPPRRFPERGGHVAGGGTRGQPTGLQHEDGALHVLHEHEGHARGLA